MSSSPARRRIKSASVTIPSKAPSAPSTGTAEMLRSASNRAMAITGVSGGTVTSSVVIRSRAVSVDIGLSFLLTQAI